MKASDGFTLFVGISLFAVLQFLTQSGSFNSQTLVTESAQQSSECKLTAVKSALRNGTEDRYAADSEFPFQKYEYIAAVRNSCTGEIFKVNVFRRRNLRKSEAEIEEMNECFARGKETGDLKQKHVFVDATHNYVMCVPPKNGVTKLQTVWTAIYDDYIQTRAEKQTLAEGTNSVFKMYWDFFHNEAYAKQLETDGLHTFEDLFRRGVVTFASLRDPLKRAFSAFSDKCFGANGTKRSICGSVVGDPNVTKFRRELSPNGQIKEAFHIFAQALSEKKKQRTAVDPHFAAQWLKCDLRCTRALFDYYVVYEKDSFGSSVRFVLSEIGLRFEAPVVAHILGTSTHHSGAHTQEAETAKLRRVYDATTNRLLADVFSEDYQLLPFELPNIATAQN